MSITNVCQQLSSEVCAAICVPLGAGTPQQTDFSCHDWWLTSRCCNGTEVQTPLTETFFDCKCKTGGFRPRGLALLIFLILAACIVICGAVFYVLHRKRKKVEAEEDQRNMAIEEAQVYLPR